MSRDHNRKNDEYNTLERRKKVSELYLQGLAQWQIAEKVGVSQPMISVDLKVIRDAWLATAILNWDELKSKELAALDLQEEELWKAWFRSCGVEKVNTATIERELRAVEGEPDVEVVKKKVKKALVSKMVPVRKSKKSVTKQLIGDPRYMAEIQKVREFRCRLLGFLKHEEEKEKQGVNINIINWDEVAKSPPNEIQAELDKLAMIPVVPIETTDSPR